MNPSNYPPGVTGNETAICGDGGFEKLCEVIGNDADCEGWTDVDCWVAWTIGRDALISARKLGAKFPHD